MAKKAKTNNLLMKIEEYVHVPFSRVVWHVVVSFAMLVLIGGVLYMFYGITPSFKEKVEKETYPQASFVSEDDVKKCVNPSRTEIVKADVVPNVTAQDELNFDTLKVALPPGRFQWEDREGSGYFNPYTYGYVYTEPKTGLENRMREALQKYSQSIPEQQLVVDNLAWVLLNQNMNYREGLLSAMMKWVIECGNNEMFDDWKRYVKIVKEKNNAPERLLYRLAGVRARNCDSGRNLVDEALRITALGDTANKVEVFDACLYGQSILSDDSLWNACNTYFIEKKALHNELVKSLICYYDLTVKINEERKEEIARIEQEFMEKSVVAEGEYLIKKGKKREARKIGFMVAIGATVTAAFFSLLLVMISMQRSLKAIEAGLNKKEKPDEPENKTNETK